MPSAFSCLGPQRLLASTLADFARGAGLELDAAALGGAACFTARRADQLIGVLALARSGEVEADLVWFGIDPAYRRQGAARDLLRVGAAWWARQGGMAIRMRSGCDPAVLRALGFAPVPSGAWMRRTA